MSGRSHPLTGDHVHSADEWEKFFALSLEMLCIIDDSGYIVKAKGVWGDKFGYTLDELMAQPFLSFAHPKDIVRLLRAIVKGRSGEIVETSFRLRCKNGTYRFIECRSQLHSGLFYTVIRDVTDKTLAQNATHESERKLSSLLANLPGMAYRCDNDHNWTMRFVSQGCYELTGYREEELLGNRAIAFNDVIDPQYRDYLWNQWQAVLSRREVFTEEYTITTATGETKWVWEQGRGIFTPTGELEAIEGLIIDITAKKRVEAALKQREQQVYEEKERLRVTLQSIGDGVITTDSRGRVVMLNTVAEDLTGWTESEAQGKPFSEVFCIYDEDSGASCEDPVQKVLDTGEIITLSSHTILRPRSGPEISIADSAAPIKNMDGSTTGVVLVFRDVTEEKRRQDEILYISYHDALTGLYNRAFFEAELKRLDAKCELPMALIVGDVNGLKVINDVFGHEEGDNTLRQIAEKLRDSCRKEDIIIRVGGDEFVVIMPETTESDAETVCSRIKESMLLMEAKPVQPSISLGYASKQEPAESLNQVFKVAEDRMYRRKLLESKSLRSSTVSSLKDALFERSNETEGHAERIGHVCHRLGRAMGLSNNQLDELRLLAMLHDVGKIAIRDGILLKPGPLDADEWVEMKKHPETGYRIAQSVYELTSIADYILSHHERWDGTGYPMGLRGEDIPLPSRILAVADAYDVMTNLRPYKAPISQGEALAEIRRCSGTQFDPGVVKVFLETVQPLTY